MTPEQESAEKGMIAAADGMAKAMATTMCPEIQSYAESAYTKGLQHFAQSVRAMCAADLHMIVKALEERK